MSSIVTEGLNRRFGQVVAIQDLNLELPDTGVVGLVGPNGSGKSTLIRILLGLIRPTSGTAEVLGHTISSPSAYLGQVGALVENPAFIPGLTARNNLASLARLRGLPLSRVDEVLDIVGLLGRDREPVRTYSLGMKQRLGIAAALLPDPRLLILDEPTNGLDPAGIVEIRSLLRTLSEDGRAVVVSSHLMAEIEAACDYLVVVKFGELMFTGPMGELLARTHQYIDISPEFQQDSERLTHALTAAGWVTESAGTAVRVQAFASDAAAINRHAAKSGITLAGIVCVQPSLESVFLELTGSSDGELAAFRSQTGKAAV